MKSLLEKNVDFLFGEMITEIKDIKVAKKSIKVACLFYVYKFAYR